MNLLSFGILSQKETSVQFNQLEIKILLGLKVIAKNKNLNKLSIFRAIVVKKLIFLSFKTIEI